MKKLLTPFLITLSLLLSIKAYSQGGSNDPTFNPTDLGIGKGVAANSAVETTTIQIDGKIIIGGGFTSYNGTASNYLARLNIDGSLDASFNIGTGTNSDVLTTAIQSDGKIIIGGGFNSYNGTARNYIARLNTDGSLDATFNVGTGTDNSVTTTAIQSDGKIIIGGDFTTYNGTARNYIARLNTDGSLDATFNVGTGTDNPVSTTAIQSDGKIIIVGGFNSYNGTASNHIARLNIDGSLDASFNVGTGANSYVKTTAIQSDGKIIIGGGFNSYNGTARNYIARLNTDGSLDVTFNVGTGTDNSVRTTAIQSDGKIIIGGYFTTYNGTSRNYIARLNTDGSLDATFNVAGTDNYVITTAIQSDGKIIIGGYFTTYNGTSSNFITRLNIDGSLDAIYNAGTGANGGVSTTAIQSDGKIIIGGNFTAYNDTARNYIARLNADGSLDASFNLGTGANGGVSTTAIQSDGKIIIGGNFTGYNGTARNHIARLNTDGSLDASFNIGTGANGFGNSTAIYSTAIQSDGKIIIGGNFTTFNGTASNYLARLNIDGSLDATFNVGTGAGGFSPTVNIIAIQSDGKIIIVGYFSSYNGTARNCIARLNTDGSLDASFNIGTGPDNWVRTIAIQSDGKIIIGGDFTTFNGAASNYLARLNADGSLDTTFNLVGTGVGSEVVKIAIQSNGRIIVSGWVFSTYIFRLNTDGSLDVSFNPGTGTNGTVYTISIQTDGNIIIGGLFTTYNGIGRNNIARILVPCVNPTVPILSASSLNNCGAQSTTLSIATGNLISAADWQWYSGSCGGTSVGSGTSITVFPTDTTIYYARGEGGCITSGICDSIEITVNPMPTATVTVSGSTIFANSSTGTYQWIDCNNSNALISGATNQNFTPSVSGNYAVIVTVNSCSDTSVCKAISIVTGIANNAQTSGLSVFPNPNNGDFTISLNKEETFSLVNNLGQTIKIIQLNQSNNNSTIITGIGNGIYFLVAKSNTMLNKKIVVEK
jgi:uncharacterized delta-60 repeat protein